MHLFPSFSVFRLVIMYFVLSMFTCRPISSQDSTKSSVLLCSASISSPIESTSSAYTSSWLKPFNVMSPFIFRIACSNAKLNSTIDKASPCFNQLRTWTLFNIIYTYSATGSLRHNATIAELVFLEFQIVPGYCTGFF